MVFYLKEHFFLHFWHYIDSKSEKYASVSINTHVIYNVTLMKFKDVWWPKEPHFYTQDYNKTLKVFFLQQ